MKYLRATLLAAAIASTVGAAPARAFDGWHLIQATTIPGPGGAWDYMSFDATHNRLFIGHRRLGLQVFDLATRKLVATIAGTAAASSNGATLMPEFDLGVSNNEDGTLIPFKLSTLEASAPVKVAAELDTSHYDPASKRLIVNAAPGPDATDAVVLEVPSLARAGAVRIASRKIEAGEGDSRGSFFIAARDVNKVFRVDMRSLAVTAEWPTPGCAQTNGLTMDAANRRIFLGCRGSDTVKPSFAVMNADTGAVVFTAEIGGGNDGIVYDAELKRVFLANGVGAVINVFEQVDADNYRPVESLGTRSGVRALVIDPKTKLLYSVTADGSADAAKPIVRTVSPFYANTFFPDTFTVLTIGK
jgi:hypothetical protein